MQIHYRILISGFFNAGKTTLIHTLDPDAFSIETQMSKYTRENMASILYNSEKETTTTGFDRGVVVWVRKTPESIGFIISMKEFSELTTEEQKDLIIRFVELKGVPGQLHFNVVRETLSIGMHGTMLLIDGSDIGSIGNALAILKETEIYMKDKPILIVANKSDLPSFLGVEEIEALVGDKVYETSALYNIGIKDALIEMLMKLEKSMVLQPM